MSSKPTTAIAKKNPSKPAKRNPRRTSKEKKRIKYATLGAVAGAILNVIYVRLRQPAWAAKDSTAKRAAWQTLPGAVIGTLVGGIAGSR